MSAAERPAPQRARAIGALLAGLVLASLPALGTRSGLLVGAWLAQPAFALAVAWWFGSRPAGEAASRWLPDAATVAILWACGWILAALLVAWPLQALLQSGSLAATLALSAASALCVIAIWRSWPMLAHAERRGSGWRALQHQIDQAEPIELATARGLWIAFAVVAVLAPLLLLAWPGLPMDAHARLRLLIGSILIAPFAHVLIHRLGAALPARVPAASSQPMATSTENLAATPYVLPYDDTRDPNDVAYTAARWGRIETALAALAHGADPNALPEPDERDQRSLPVLAAVLTDLSLLRELIARGADLNRVHAGLTPLLAATRDSWHGRIEAVTMLLANGADPRVTDAEGNTPLHHSARSSDASVAALLLDAGAQVDTCNHEGNSALFVACAGGNWRLARFLLEHGARCEPGEGQPALLAAASGEDEVAGVQLLLKHKARVDARGNAQRTALMLACEADNPDIVGVLLDEHAAIDARDAGGMTALMHAAANGNESVLPRLAKSKPDAGTVDDGGLNALAHACRSESSEPSLIRTLLGMGVNPQHVSADGRTALDHAVSAGRWRLVAELDPTHPLPETIAEDIAIAPVERSTQELLRDALAARRFDRAKELLRPSTEDHAALLAILLPQFALEADADVFDWLLLRGADAERRNGFDDNVLFTLLDRGGTFAGAIARLLDHAVSPAGASGLARYLGACAASEASSRAHEQLALALLERGADPFGVVSSNTSVEGDSALALAIRLGWMRLAEQLLTRGAAVDARDSNALTPLHLATTLGREAAVKLLVRSGANAGLRTPNGETALGMALAADRSDLGKWLEWRGWRLPRRPLRDTDLPAAAMVGDAAAVARLIDLGLPINAVDSQGCSALLRAAGGGHLDVLEALLKRHADTAIAAATGATALSAAVSMRHAQVVERLLGSGANVDQPVSGGVTPLMLAAALGLPDMVARLLAHRADIRKTDESGLGALHCACMHAFHSHDRQRTMALLDTLLLSDAGVDATSQLGETPLLLLLGSRAEPGRPRDEDVLLEAMESLLDENVQLDAHEQRGFTPLHMAALHGLGRVVQRLLRAGANPRPLDTAGRTPHQLALQRGLIDIAAEFEPVRSNATPSLARFLRKE